jgi:hypothetical protein
MIIRHAKPKDIKYLIDTLNIHKLKSFELIRLEEICNINSKIIKATICNPAINYFTYIVYIDYIYNYKTENKQCISKISFISKTKTEMLTTINNFFKNQ